MTDLTFSKLDPDPIATTLGTRGPKQFHDALQWVECTTQDVKTAKLPPSLRMIRVLWHLELESDLQSFLYVRHQFAPWVAEAAEFCREIDAGKCAAALARVVALFPKGMPRNIREYSQAGGFNGPLSDALKAIDDELAESFGELSAALRTWLRANRDGYSGRSIA